jgi:hypoxanthine phosphoribosyltransferase
MATVKEVFYNTKQINGFLLNINKQMVQDNFRPDYIVGIARGGLVPALKLSHYLDVPMYCLSEEESNLWMAEDAFGYVNVDGKGVSVATARKNILIIDDINDSGTTLSNLKQDWQSGCMPHNGAWNDIWHRNVKFAVCIDNEASAFNSDYQGYNINKFENPEWCVFPWENWWIEPNN